MNSTELLIKYEHILSQNEPVLLKDTISIFFTTKKTATTIYHKAINSAHAHQFTLKLVDNNYYANPESFIFWLMDNDMFPKEALKLGLFRMLKYHNEYEKLLDRRKYHKLPENNASLILQAAENEEIDIYIQLKHRGETLGCVETESGQIFKYPPQEHSDRIEAYRRVITKKTYWKLNNSDFYGNYITLLHQDNEISEKNNGLNNIIYFEQTDEEKELGINFYFKGRRITLNDVFILQKDMEEITDTLQSLKSNITIKKSKNYLKKFHELHNLIINEIKLDPSITSTKLLWSALKSKVDKKCTDTKIVESMYNWNCDDPKITWKSHNDNKSTQLTKSTLQKIFSQLLEEGRK